MMERMLMCSGFVLIALAMQAQMSGGVGKSIADMEHQWAAAAKAANPDAIAPMLADNFVALDSDGTMHNRSESLARVKGGKWDINEISDVKVTTTGDTAIATGAWRGKGVGGDGKSVDAKERWVDTWVKGSNGKWQCVASGSAPVKM